MHSGWLVYKFYAKIGNSRRRGRQLGDARYLMGFDALCDLIGQSVAYSVSQSVRHSVSHSVILAIGRFCLLARLSVAAICANKTIYL